MRGLSIGFLLGIWVAVRAKDLVPVQVRGFLEPGELRGGGGAWVGDSGLAQVARAERNLAWDVL